MNSNLLEIWGYGTTFFFINGYE